MSRYVLITPDPGFERRARQAASGLHGTFHAIAADHLPPGPDDLLRVLSGDPVEVILLGPGLQVEDSIRLASLFDLQYPEISVVLVTESEEGIALPAMRAGIRDLLQPGSDVATIRSLLERASLAAAGRRRGLGSSVEGLPRRGRIISVMSPKGGVGKTTITTNLAVGLGKEAPMGVVVVDLDLQFGDVATALMLEPERTLADAVVGAAVQDSVVLKSYLTLHPSGIYALCAPLRPTDADQISGEQVGRLLSQLSNEFQYVVVDTAPGLGEHVLATLELATDAVWICGMDIPSIRGLRTGFGILAELDLVPENRHLVLNFADRRTGLTLQDVEATIGSPVDVVLPRSRAVPFSTNKGVPLLQDGTRDPVTKGLRQLVERFSADWESRPHKKLHRRAVVQ
ncbi:AAA family ATPase [Pseudarthrobacter albicanus]|uniref:AAA family ATPase n=1 Tax=Pseudarthrobacter albicanus TaxID=2823873 RepID=UPI001BAE2B1F|nr:AAA family ATPase [Pseudarthrobacter albicanus]